MPDEDYLRLSFATIRELNNRENADIEVGGDVLREKDLELFRGWRDQTRGGKANGAKI